MSCIVEDTVRLIGDLRAHTASVALQVDERIEASKQNQARLRAKKAKASCQQCSIKYLMLCSMQYAFDAVALSFCD